MASSSSTTTAILHQARRYDVFLSFKGEDIRNDFRSHLHEALCRNQILTFIDDNLERGDNISPSLLTAIEESIIFVIIFSENYADSKWCLKELAKILQCREDNDQIVIPVFYGVDPSHIGKQIRKFGLAFDKLKERLDEGEMDLNEVRSHLEEAANIFGWNSQIISPESKLIKSIVGDILNKLNRVTLNLPSNLVGIGSHIERVETLLCLESPQFRIVGIWGMGGIGKTTVAHAIFKRIHDRFERSHFVENVSKELRNQSVDDMREKIVSKLFEEERLNMGNQNDFIMEQLQRKKVLIVLDDVDDVEKAMNLFDVENLPFCGGSRILVTSRDKQLLRNIVGDDDHIYEVTGLIEEDGLQLFSLRAFKQNHPTSDSLELSKRVLSYARGNPLVLVVLGRALFGKTKEEWVSALGELREEPFPEIQKVLRISYDALCDQEKTIFLDIACFLVGKQLDFVVAYYKGSVNRIQYKISKLVDKSLITISEDKRLEMHDLLKEMGRSIESAKELKKRTRIWDLKDITHVSKTREGSLMIEAININLLQVERISELDCNVFARLDGLKFLEFEGSKVRLCWEHFKGFSEELRYFSWYAFPLKSLPSNFCIENLVELHMQHTTIRELWTGKENIVNLKIINLHGAKQLVEFPDVSEGKNIEKIYLSRCESLVKLSSSSIQHLPKLKVLDLGGTSCESVPTNYDSKVLTDLGLAGCRGIKIFPQLASRNVIETIYLDNTYIIEVPSSIEFLTALEMLSMNECRKLSIISTNISKLKSLRSLFLSDCTNLESFPEIMEPMESLVDLHLNGCTGIKSLPSSIHNMRNLKNIDANRTSIEDLPESIEKLLKIEWLSLSRCKRLRSLPANMKEFSQLILLDVAGCCNLYSLPELPPSLEVLYGDGCQKLSIISTNICKLKSLQQLHLSECTNLESFPEIMEPMESLKELYLNGCKRLKRLPSDHNSFHNLKSLKKLEINGTAITELPSSIQHLTNLKLIGASGTSIEDLPESIGQLLKMECLTLSSCKRLRSLPANMKQLSQLITLDVSGCCNLYSLPELPPSLETLDVYGCYNLYSLPELPPSLKTLDVCGCVSLLSPSSKDFKQTTQPSMHTQSVTTNIYNHLI